ncbi:N(6)-adenine-specific methyltransferase METTL4 [Anthonomus grandis grandis]|uniref:N(6)-adenine-specific methyltransferase METTL4 n=1 Tax=Anthonomus grandis grandis TaxID=2921223 RepID=UPI002165460D|nr:N(6)-adenine-specific methyltransferase METTL4 [Anthonomus grandis grandis]XP_050306450.1 N(6)-adenine-specific methyltransferase METTL4 [Anthonomus grandis grandis]XP_050306451.1 N(6)-adenine-specific methyltransferase METTL4 [Anthonomus grandis grandis]
MSILFKNDTGMLISTEQYLNSCSQMPDNSPKINKHLFDIFSPYATLTKKRKKTNLKEMEVEPKFLEFEKEVLFVEQEYTQLVSLLRKQGYFKNLEHQNLDVKNVKALEAADTVYTESGKHLIKNALGSNFGPTTIKYLQNSRYMFPENSEFFCKDVTEIGEHLKNRSFDLVLLDPPWWNKYIRRKKRKCEYGYEMMYNCDLRDIPIESLVTDAGVVVVWCTNSPQHLKYLLETIFPKWNINFLCKFYWVKVTVYGDPVCKFSKPPGKQPFEQIIIGVRNKDLKARFDNSSKLLISVPSSIHSHKPPLVEVLQPFLPKNPKCLEIFARYLLPNWTSYGNEVLRFQHESLYSLC